MREFYEKSMHYFMTSKTWVNDIRKQYIEVFGEDFEKSHRIKGLHRTNILGLRSLKLSNNSLSK